MNSLPLHAPFVALPLPLNSYKSIHDHKMQMLSLVRQQQPTEVVVNSTRTGPEDLLSLYKNQEEQHQEQEQPERPRREDGQMLLLLRAQDLLVPLHTQL